MSSLVLETGANLSLLKELQPYLVSGDATRWYYIIKAAQFTLFLLLSPFFFLLILHSSFSYFPCCRNPWGGRLTQCEMLRGTLCHAAVDNVSERNEYVCMFETTCTGWEMQDPGDRKAWCLSVSRRNSQPWSSFWETAAARIILSSCLHKREDLFYKHPVISWTHICGHSRSELHHPRGRSIFWPAFSCLPAVSSSFQCSQTGDHILLSPN